MAEFITNPKTGRPMTAKALGYKAGDFVLASGFPAVVVSQVNTCTPVVEAWGVEHEAGSAYAAQLRRISAAEFWAAVELYGHKRPLRTYYPAAGKALAQSTAGA